MHCLVLWLEIVFSLVIIKGLIFDSLHSSSLQIRKFSVYDTYVSITDGFRRGNWRTGL